MSRPLTFSAVGKRQTCQNSYSQPMQASCAAVPNAGLGKRVSCESPRSADLASTASTARDPIRRIAADIFGKSRSAPRRSKRKSTKSRFAPARLTPSTTRACWAIEKSFFPMRSSVLSSSATMTMSPDTGRQATRPTALSIMRSIGSAIDDRPAATLSSSASAIVRQLMKRLLTLTGTHGSPK